MEILQNDLSLAVLSFAAVFMIIVGFWIAFGERVIEKYNSLAEAYREKFVLELQFPDDVPKVFGAYIGVTLLLLVGVSFLSIFAAPIVLLVAYFLPLAVYDYKKTVRTKKINSVLPNVLQQLAANTKNTGSISLALQEVALTAPDPMDYELALISRQEIELKSFALALNNARGRLNSQWFDIVSAVLITADEKGGRTSAALENLSKVFTQLIKMQAKIDTATSQGRMSMKLMLAMPFVVIGIVYLVDPKLIALAVSSFAGVMMISVAAFFYILSLGIAIWLSKVKI
jgi:tight adherence protein B